MLKYQPPKSNIWGHSLRRMTPPDIVQRLSGFFAIAIAEHHFGTSHLSIHDSAEVASVIRKQSTSGPFELSKETLEIVNRCGRLTGATPRYGYFNLTEAQFERCLETLISDPGVFGEPQTSVLFSRSWRITKWKIDSLEVSTESTLSVDFAADPHITTFLRFNNLTEFNFVRDAFTKTKLCKLNEKHLREVKPKKK